MILRQMFTAFAIWLVVAVAFSLVATAAVTLGTGNNSLVGGDLSDPENLLTDAGDYATAKPEAEMKPPKATWLNLVCGPTSAPGATGHQIHAYHSWQNSPACAIFLNKPETSKWFISFIDGGNGGPTEDEPFFCAIELKQAHVLTHFTLTSAAEMPDRDPLQWAIQGSNTGDDQDWVDIYRCDATDRVNAPFREDGRMETNLFTSFTSDSMAKDISPAELQKLTKRLRDKTIPKADFLNKGIAYSWFRIVVYSCFNPNSTTFEDFNRPPGFSLGQLELFGTPGPPPPNIAKARAPRVKLTASELIKPEAYDPAFIISYWCGPPKAETTVERYQEIKDCGFNVAHPAIDIYWEPSTPANDDHNRKYLDVCQKVGLKGLVWDGAIPKGNVWNKPAASEIPQIEKSLDGLIEKYASHPAFFGYVLGDEMGIEQHPRLGIVTQYLLKKDPQHLPYYNLLPNYAFKQNSEYEAMVSDYIETVKPALVSWDHYRQMFEGGDEKFYWHNLEIMRKLCLKKQIPFNQIIVSFKHMGYRECSEADMRWQVYTSLAYGSRGIQYFTYWFVKDLAWAEAPALISKDGKRDVKWDYVKKINHRIAKLGPTLARLTSTGVYCTAPIPPGGRKVRAGSPVTKAEGGPLAIGCFQDPEGKQYLMVVNRSFDATVTAALTLNERIISVAEISQETGAALEPQPTTQKPLAVPLQPGEGRLFVLSETGLFYRPLAEIHGGKDIDLTTIDFEPLKPENKSTGSIFWRKKGQAAFTSLPLAAVDATHFKITLPSAITAAPFEYYIEMKEPNEKPVYEPELGPEAPLVATPDQTPPTVVAGLTASTIKSYRVTLAWRPASDDRGVAGYRIYRGAEDAFAIGDKVALSTAAASDQTFTDDSPPRNQTVWYALQAVDVVGRLGALQYVRVDVPDHQPPDNTIVLHATPGSKSVILTWSGEMEPIVSSLEIYRGESSEGETQKIGEVTDMLAANYIDKEAVYGNQYRYEMRPRSREGLLGKSGTIVTGSPLKYLRRINCGGPEIASQDGVSWEADGDGEHSNLITSGTATYPVTDPIRGTGIIKDLCQTERWANGKIGYTFNVDPGRYEVLLVFAETNPHFFEAAQRPFDILINGQKVAEKVDIVTKAGGPMTSWECRNVVEITDRNLTILLAANDVGPALKAIEIRSVNDE